jgi:hypothetical protein
MKYLKLAIIAAAASLCAASCCPNAPAPEPTQPMVEATK